jgi:Zn-dependent protease with chaperone function
MIDMSAILYALPAFLVVAGTLIQQPEIKPGIPSPQPRIEPDFVPVPEPSPRALSYHQSGNLLWLVDTAWRIILPGMFLFGGLSARIRTFAQELGKRRFYAVELYIIFFIALVSFYTLPLSFYSGYVREHVYGLSNQTLGKWFCDWILGRVVNLVAACLVLWIPYYFLQKSPRRWWLYTSILMVPILFAGLMVLPVWVAPLFNDFGDLKDERLEAKILALADRAGIEGGRVYEVDKSVDTKAVNAYVVGFLTTKRIVLWDTLLNKLPEDQVLFVMGHEMGHFVLHHLIQGILVASLLILVTLFLVHHASSILLRRLAGRFGFDQLSDVASLPLVVMLINFFALFIMPVGLAFSRHIEYEADRFGLEITQDNRAAAMSFVGLERENLGVPRPGWFYQFWRGSHPSTGERIDFCNEYRPWERGEPLKYGHLFRTR